MRYLPHTDEDLREMLRAIGAPTIDALFGDIPPEVRLNKPLALEPALDEASLMKHLTALASKNTSAPMLSFIGAGLYHHHIPPAVDQLLLRSEFYTAYTPYQPEVAQGTLQSIFEFQTMVAEIFGMEIANASMYDGASAAAEAVTMARRVTGRHHVVVSAGLHPEYIETIRTYLRNIDDGKDELSIVPLAADGRTDAAALEKAMRDDTALVILGYPNVLGVVEDLATPRASASRRGALLATATWEPYALGVIQPPGAFDVDIAVGEGQALAVPPQLGGPGVGLFCTRKQHVNKMPGRLVGETVDQAGERGYVLTLSTREQHIRREKATSNICTNHGLIALAFTMRTAMLGKRGFVEIASQCLAKSEYLKGRIAELGKKSGNVSIVASAPTFNEFVVRTTGSAAALLASLSEQGILGGVPLAPFFPGGAETDFLVAVTERHDKADLDRFADALCSSKG
jgi:glycine dehydrogenase subunit 1